MRPSTPLIAALLALPLCATVVQAAGYQISTIGDGSNFVGCLAQNETAGVGFLAVGATVAMFGNTAKFPFAKGDAVTGSWSIDGGTTYPFSSKADSPHTVTIEVPNTAEAVTSLVTGKNLAVTANNISSAFDLDGAGKAFNDLSECMIKNQKP